MKESKQMETAIKGILKSLLMLESQKEQDEQTRQDIAAMLGNLWEFTGKVNAYYRDKYELDKPSSHLLETGRQIFELREQGLSQGEICKRLGIRRGIYYHLLVEYQHYRRKHGGES